MTLVLGGLQTKNSITSIAILNTLGGSSWSFTCLVDLHIDNTLCLFGKKMSHKIKKVFIILLQGCPWCLFLSPFGLKVPGLAKYINNDIDNTMCHFEKKTVS